MLFALVCFFAAAAAYVSRCRVFLIFFATLICRCRYRRVYFAPSLRFIFRYVMPDKAFAARYMRYTI